MEDAIIRYWPLVTQITVGTALLGITWVYLPLLWGAPWVPARMCVARKMLELADVQPGQRVIDLGAGDGRIVTLAARGFGAQATGVEVDPIRCLIANGLIALRGLRNRARVQWGSMYSVDLADADVVIFYLWPKANRRLEPILAAGLRPGAKVVTHQFSMINWHPIAVDQESRIYLYEIGRTEMDIGAMLAQEEV